jgi:hypothetical protein
MNLEEKVDDILCNNQMGNQFSRTDASNELTTLCRDYADKFVEFYSNHVIRDNPYDDVYYCRGHKYSRKSLLTEFEKTLKL